MIDLLYLAVYPCVDATSSVAMSLSSKPSTWVHLGQNTNVDRGNMEMVRAQADSCSQTDSRPPSKQPPTILRRSSNTSLRYSLSSFFVDQRSASAGSMQRSIKSINGESYANVRGVHEDAHNGGYTPERFVRMESTKNAVEIG
jgi:hypothetical protein